MVRRFLWLAVMLLVVSAASLVTAREWKDASGTFRVQAELVTIKEGKAYLEKASGDVIQVPLEKLSKEDLTYLAELPAYRKYFAENPLPGLDAGPRMVKIKVLDESKVGEIRRTASLGWPAESLTFSPDAGLLALGKMDKMLLVYDINQDALTRQSDRLEILGEITEVAFTPDGKRLLSGGKNGPILAWTVNRQGRLSPSIQLVGHRGTVRTIAIANDGQHMLSGSEDKSVRCWRLDTGAQVFAIDSFAGPVIATRILPTNTEGLASDGRTLLLFDLQQGNVLRTMQLTQSPDQNCAQISRDGTYIVVSDKDSLRLWRISDGTERPPFQDRERQWSVAFSPDSKYLISGGAGVVNVWELEGSRKIREFDLASGKAAVVKGLDYSPDGRHVAATASLPGQSLQIFRLPAEMAQ